MNYIIFIFKQVLKVKINYSSIFQPKISQIPQSRDRSNPSNFICVICGFIIMIEPLFLYLYSRVAVKPNGRRLICAICGPENAE